MTEKDPIISIRNAVVTYAEHTGEPVRALDDVSLDIYPNEYIIFFGPSGCGKSTLLYTIAGLEKLTSGTVIVDGHDLVKLSVKENILFHRRTIGMVFQAYYLISTLTNLQNIVLPQIFSSASPKNREAAANIYLKRFGIEEQADKYPNELSGGQQQRVSIARSLINRAPILLADEPVGNLDSKSSDSVLQVFSELNKQDGKTVILVTHNPNHLQYADRVFYMKDGRIIREVENRKKDESKSVDEIKPVINHGLREFARIYPHLDEEHLRAKMVTWYLLNEIDIEAEQRLEELVHSYLKKELTLDQFIEKSTASIRKAGIGLYHPYAARLAMKLEHIASMSEYMVDKFKKYPATYEEYQEILSKVTAYLLEATEHTADDTFTERMQSILKSRLEGSIGHDGFMDFLDKPFSAGGLGLNVRTARNLARQLELLLMNFDEMRKGIGDKSMRPHLYGIRRPQSTKPNAVAHIDGVKSPHTQVNKKEVDGTQIIINKKIENSKITQPEHIKIPQPKDPTKPSLYISKLRSVMKEASPVTKTPTPPQPNTSVIPEMKKAPRAPLPPIPVNKYSNATRLDRPVSASEVQLNARYLQNRKQIEQETQSQLTKSVNVINPHPILREQRSSEVVEHVLPIPLNRSSKEQPTRLSVFPPPASTPTLTAPTERNSYSIFPKHSSTYLRERSTQQSTGREHNFRVHTHTEEPVMIFPEKSKGLRQEREGIKR